MGMNDWRRLDQGLLIYKFLKGAFYAEQGPGESVKPITGRFPVHICHFTKVKGVKKCINQGMPKKNVEGGFYNYGQNTVFTLV